jgi:hypothetical protein
MVQSSGKLPSSTGSLSPSAFSKVPPVPTVSLTAAEILAAEQLKTTSVVLPRSGPSVVTKVPPALGGTQGSLPDNWPAWGTALRNAARSHANQWIWKAEIVTGIINAQIAILQPGWFRSSYMIAPAMTSELTAAGLPAPLANALASQFAAAWEAWSGAVTCPGMPLFPSFVAWPGPQAPPTPAVPVPMAALGAGGLSALLAPNLAQRWQNALPSGYNQNNARQPLLDAATWFTSRFLPWQTGAVLTNVLGWGPVPSYAPPYVPVGPVANGTFRAPPGFISSQIS